MNCISMRKTSTYCNEQSKLPLTHAPVSWSQTPPAQWLQSYGSRPKMSVCVCFGWVLINSFGRYIFDFINFGRKNLPVWTQIGWWSSTWQFCPCAHWWYAHGSTHNELMHAFWCGHSTLDLQPISGKCTWIND